MLFVLVRYTVEWKCMGDLDGAISNKSAAALVLQSASDRFCWFYAINRVLINIKVLQCLAKYNWIQ